MTDTPGAKATPIDVRDIHAFLDSLAGTVTLAPPKSLPGGRAVHGY